METQPTEMLIKGYAIGAAVAKIQAVYDHVMEEAPVDAHLAVTLVLLERLSITAEEGLKDADRPIEATNFTYFMNRWSLERLLKRRQEAGGLEACGDCEQRAGLFICRTCHKRLCNVCATGLDAFYDARAYRGAAPLNDDRKLHCMPCALTLVQQAHKPEK